VVRAVRRRARPAVALTHGPQRCFTTLKTAPSRPTTWAEYYAAPGLAVRTLVDAQRHPGWRYDDFLATTRFRMTEYAGAQ
jgi:hypothetical protein